MKKSLSFDKGFFILLGERTGGKEKYALWKHFSRRGVIVTDR